MYTLLVGRGLWRREFIDNLLCLRMQEFEVFSEYTMALGAV